MNKEPRYKSKYGIVATLLLACSLCALGCMRGHFNDLALLKQKAVPVEFHPLTPERWQLPNGLSIVFLNDKEIPIVSGTLYLKGGSLWEPQNQLGSLVALGGQLRSGGAGSLGADELDLELEKLSASIASGFSGEYGTVSFSCLSEDLERVFSIFADVVLRPRLEQARLDLWKGQALDSIKRRTDDPNTVAGIAFNQLLYGNTVYGKTLIRNDIAKISRSNLQELYKRFVAPNGAILAVSGSVDKAKLESLVSNAFGRWQARKDEFGPAPLVIQATSPGIYFIELPFEQATVNIGHLGVKRLTPDFPAIEVFNELFGSSGFGSRLMLKVRTEQGLAYGVYGGIAPAVVRGKNLIVLQTKASTAAQAIIESIRVLRSFQDMPVELSDLDKAKANIENSFVFRFDSTANLVDRHAMLQLLEYPKDYDETYLSKLSKVNSEEIQQVAKTRWAIQDFVIVVVGNSSAYNSLESLMANQPEELRGLSLKKVRFEEKLIL